MKVRNAPAADPENGRNDVQGLEGEVPRVQFEQEDECAGEEYRRRDQGDRLRFP
jgi:hypothetical protein